MMKKLLCMLLLLAMCLGTACADELPHKAFESSIS